MPNSTRAVSRTARRASTRKPSPTRRARRAAGRGAAAHTGHDPSDLNRTLKALSGRIADAKRDIAQARKRTDKAASAHRDAQDAVNRLTTETDMLEGAVAIVNAQQGAIASERQAASKDLDEAQAWLARARRRLHADKLFPALRKTVGAIDADIDRLTSQIAELESEAANAEADASAAEERASSAARARRQTEDALRRLPAEIREAREQLVTLVRTLEASTEADPWRLEAAERQVTDAVDAVRRHVRSREEDTLIPRLLAAVDADARADVERASARLAEARRALVEARGARERLIQRRDVSIKELVFGGKGV